MNNLSPPSSPVSLVIHHFPPGQYPTMEQHLLGMSYQELEFFGDFFTDSIWVYSSDELDIYLDTAEEIARRDYPHCLDSPPELYAEHEIDFNAAQNFEAPSLPFQYDNEPIFELNFVAESLAAENDACLKIRQHFDVINIQCMLRQEQINNQMDAVFDMNMHLDIAPFF